MIINHFCHKTYQDWCQHSFDEGATLLGQIAKPEETASIVTHLQWNIANSINYHKEHKESKGYTWQISFVHLIK